MRLKLTTSGTGKIIRNRSSCNPSRKINRIQIKVLCFRFEMIIFELFIRVIYLETITDGSTINASIRSLTQDRIHLLGSDWL